MYRFILLFVLFSAVAHAQMLHFKVVNINTFSAIKDVSVSSSIMKAETFKTDADGNVYVNYIPGDTIKFDKALFHPFVMNIIQKDYDFKHVIEIVLIPTSSKAPAQKLDKLASFEYHFVHDTLGENSDMKISVFENIDVSNQRQELYRKHFRFAHVDIKEKAKGSGDKYDLKKK